MKQAPLCSENLSRASGAFQFPLRPSSGRVVPLTIMIAALAFVISTLDSFRTPDPIFPSTLSNLLHGSTPAASSQALDPRYADHPVSQLFLDFVDGRRPMYVRARVSCARNVPYTSRWCRNSLYPRTHHFLHVFIPFTNSHIERHDFLHDTEPATLSRPVVPFLFILTHKGCL